MPLPAGPSWPLTPGSAYHFAEATAERLFDAAETDLGDHAALVLLPLADHGDRDPIAGALQELTRVVVQLFPAWLPEAADISGPGGAGIAAVEAIAREVARNSPLYGPILERLARAALLDDTEPDLSAFARETVALELVKLVRAAYRVADVAIILPADGPMRDDQIATVQHCALWLAQHGRVAVWVVGAHAARMDRLRPGLRPPRAASPILTEPARTDAEPIPTAAISILPGQPNPISRVEKRIEAQLAKAPWAEGRAWNLRWRAGQTHPTMYLDLVWTDERVVIEFDGLDHLDPVKYRKDRLRDRLLQRAGYSVLRFTNQDVYDDIGAVLAFIEAFIAARRQSR